MSQLIDRITNGEDQVTEFKQRLTSIQDVSKTVCAFANTLGGMIVVGISDDRSIVGVPQDQLDRVQKELSHAAQDITPRPMISIAIESVEGFMVVFLKVNRPSDNAYYTYKGAIWVRVGSTTRKLEGQTLLDYLRGRQILSFDEATDSLAREEDLDETKIRRYLDVRDQSDFLHHRSIMEFLVNSQLVSHEGRLKNSAVLVFAKHPTLFFSQAEIRLVRFDGSESVKILASQFIQTDLASAIDVSLAFLRTHISKQLIVGSRPQRDEIYEYPLPVLREAIINAVVHRDYFNINSIQVSIYDDRIIIVSPGSVPKGMVPELFGSLSVKRNPIIYRILRDFRYIEGLGTGVPRMIQEMRNAGLPDPRFEFDGDFFFVELRRKKIFLSAEGVDRISRLIVYLGAHKTVTAKEYAAMETIARATANKDLLELVHKGRLIRVGKTRGAYYTLS